jgi:DNA-binding transcriptional ArsR family regulator
MSKADPLLVARTAERFAALGAEPRLQIVRLLLSAHPAGMVAGDIQQELEIPASTLSHHLERLKQVGLVQARREGTFLWYTASTDSLREILGFLYEECCTRSRAVPAESIIQISK